MKKICTCNCHKRGEVFIHFFPCCKYTYEEYLDKEGRIDEEKYNEIVKAYNNPPKPRKRKKLF